MADITFAKNVKKVWDNEVDANAGTWKAMLLVSEGAAYTPNAGTDVFVATAAVDECSVSGYARQTLAFSVVTSIANAVHDHGDGILTWRSDPPVFTGLASGETANRIVIYKEVTNDTDSLMFCCLDLPNPGFATSLGQITVEEPVIGGYAGWFKV